MNNLELLFAQYKKNIDRATELNEHSFEAHENEPCEIWYPKIEREKDKIYRENTVILNELNKILEQPLTPAIAERLYEQSFMMYTGDYDDSQLLMNIFSKLELYYEKENDLNRLLPMYVAHSYEKNAIQLCQAFSEDMDKTWLEKVLSYEKCYRELNEECRISFWKAVYNYVMVGMDRGTWNVNEAFEMYEKYSKFYEDNKDFEKDGEKPVFQNLYKLFHETIVFSILGINDATPETLHKFQSALNEFYEADLKEKKDVKELSGVIYAGHLYTLYLSGDESIDSIFDKYCDFYQYRDLKIREKDVVSPDDLYFYFTSIRFLKNLALLGINPEKIKMLLGLYRVLSDNKWKVQDVKVLLNVIDLNKSLCDAIITFSDNEEEIEKCYKNLNIKKNFLSYVHSKHVADLSVLIFEKCYEMKPELFNEYKQMEYEHLRMYVEKCGFFHDLGSIATSFLYFYSYRPLFKEEFDLIYSKPISGAGQIDKIPQMKKYLDVMMGHHKSYDGKSGFPYDYDNTVSEQKLIVDLVHIADAIDLSFDNFLSHGAKPDFNKLLEEMREGMGTEYHPEMIQVLLDSDELRKRIKKEIESNYESIREYYKTQEEVIVHQSIEEFLAHVDQKFREALVKNDFGEFLPLLDRLFVLSQKEYSDRLLGIGYYYSMWMHSYKNEYADSINAGLECVRYLEQTEEYHKCCLAYNIIGAMMETTGNLDNGLNYYLLSCEKAKLCKDSNLHLLRAYNNIANLMKNVGQLDRAIYYYDLAEKLEYDDIEIMIPMLCNVMYCHIESGNIGKVQEYEAKILNMLQDGEYPVFLVNVYFAYLQEFYQNYTLMDEYLQKALTDKEYYNDYVEFIDEIHLYLNLLEKIGRYDELENALSIYIELFSKHEISFREFQSFLQQRARCARKRKDMDTLMITLDLLEENLQKERGFISQNALEQENMFWEHIERDKKQKQILKEKERLEEEVKEAWDANKAKSSFLSSMSHEIRTPIHAILGLDEMILRECQDEGILDYAKDIENAGKTLLGIINDVLDFSKMEAGKLEIIPEDYDTAEMILDLRNMILPRAKEKGLEFNVNCDASVPKKLHGDDLRIKQVIINILTNAVKYTKEGQVDFTITFQKLEEDQNLLCVSVKDTGIGMKETDLEKLYRPFERIEEKQNRNIEGTGLGMSIVMSLIKQMGGSLKVNSEYGKGSEFIVMLPQKIVDGEGLGDLFSKKKVIEKRKSALFTASDAKILVVDDNAVNIKVVTNLLKRTEVQVTTAMSGKDCLAICHEKQFDLILLDHRMPVMDGVETLEHLRKESLLNRETPVIALTANAVSGAYDYYREVGFHDLLTKPVNVAEMEKKIMMYLPKSLLN